MAKNEKNAPVADKDVANAKVSEEDKLQNEAAREFDNILDDDEKIMRVIKPHKGKVYLSRLLSIFIPIFVYLAIIVAVSFIPSEETIDKTGIIIEIVTCASILAVILALVIWFTALFYKHTIYAVTNKRLIIRTGIFGVDFKSLDYKNLGASDVYVSLLDKLYRKNTGTLRFGNASSPMGTSKMYCFANIVDPYGLYKEIKQYIAKQQDTKHE